LDASFVPVGAVYIFLSGSVSASANPFSTSGWNRIESPAGAFVVMMPGVPEAARGTEAGASGPVAMHSYVYQAGNEGYGVTYRDYSNNLDPSAVLTEVRNGLVGHGSVIVESSATAAGHPGRMVTWTNDGKTWAAVFFVAGPRLYQVIYTGTGLQALTHGTAYLRSFELTR
jgi:hypothetical protein